MPVVDRCTSLRTSLKSSKKHNANEYFERSEHCDALWTCLSNATATGCNMITLGPKKEDMHTGRICARGSDLSYAEPRSGCNLIIRATKAPRRLVCLKMHQRNKRLSNQVVLRLLQSNARTLQTMSQLGQLKLRYGRCQWWWTMLRWSQHSATGCNLITCADVCALTCGAFLHYDKGCPRERVLTVPRNKPINHKFNYALLCRYYNDC